MNKGVSLDKVFDTIVLESNNIPKKMGELNIPFADDSLALDTVAMKNIMEGLKPMKAPSPADEDVPLMVHSKYTHRLKLPPITEDNLKPINANDNLFKELMEEATGKEIDIINIKDYGRESEAVENKDNVDV